MLFLLDPSALLHLYLQCVHSTAPVAKVGPLATVRGLLITFAARRYFTVLLEERLVVGLLRLRSRFLKRLSLLLHSCGIGVWDWRSVLMMNRPRSTNDSLSAEAFPAACSSIILPIIWPFVRMQPRQALQNGQKSPGSLQFSFEHSSNPGHSPDDTSLGDDKHRGRSRPGTTFRILPLVE